MNDRTIYYIAERQLVQSRNVEISHDLQSTSLVIFGSRQWRDKTNKKRGRLFRCKENMNLIQFYKIKL